MDVRDLLKAICTDEHRSNPDMDFWNVQDNDFRICIINLYPDGKEIIVERLGGAGYCRKWKNVPPLDKKEILKRFVSSQN